MNIKLTVSFVLALLVFLSIGCGGRQASPQSYLAQRGIAPACAGVMTVCSGFGCTRLSKVQLDSQQLLQLDVLFLPRPAHAAQERERIALAVALLESMVGQLAGTQNDLAKNKRNFAPSGQLDCIAETTNTTVYLLLLQEKGLLVHHKVAPPEHRGSSVFTAHNTAVIIDAQGKEYAVDSWFHANGELPEIVDLSSWRLGFDPTDILPQHRMIDESEKAADENKEAGHGV